jgi:hypothetical protein
MLLAPKQKCPLEDCFIGSPGSSYSSSSPCTCIPCNNHMKEGLSLFPFCGPHNEGWEKSTCIGTHARFWAPEWVTPKPRSLAQWPLKAASLSFPHLAEMGRWCRVSCNGLSLVTCSQLCGQASHSQRHLQFVCLESGRLSIPFSLQPPFLPGISGKMFWKKWRHFYDFLLT